MPHNLNLARAKAGGVVAVANGVLFGVQSVDALCDALGLLDTLRLDPSALRAAAEPFASESFDRAFLAAFERGYEDWRGTSATEVPASVAR